MNIKFKRVLSMVMAIMLIVPSVVVPTYAADVSVADHVIISQVYGGGGNSGAVYTNDFIELYNPTGATVDLAGWSVQYTGSTGIFGSTSVLELTGVIEPDSYYLIQCAAGANTELSALPTPDLEGTFTMSSSKGKVALVSAIEPITVSTTDSETGIVTVIKGIDNPTVVDFVGFGAANEFEGSAPTPTLSNSTAAIRKVEGVDTDDNSADFIVGAPSPRNSTYGTVETKCALPTVDVASGLVDYGTALTFSSTTADATIEYNTVSASSDTWTSGNSVTVENDATYYVRAVKEGLLNSNVATFTYTVDYQIKLNIYPEETDVVSGATVSITTNAENGTIFHTFEPVASTTSAIIAIENVQITTSSLVTIQVEGNIGDTVTLSTFALAEGRIISDVVQKTFTIIDPNDVPSIKEVLLLPDGTENVSVRGILSYYATTYDNPVIQSVIDGEIYSLYVFGKVPDGAQIGDEIRLKGKFVYYNKIPQISNITDSAIIEHQAPIPPVEMTIAELNEQGLNMLTRVVKIKDVTLGAYNGGGSTPISDATGTINIYKAAPYPTLVEAGDIVDVYAIVSRYNSTVQLATGTAEANGFNTYDIVNDIKNPLLTLNDIYPDAKPNQIYTVSVKAEDNKGIQDVKLSYTIDVVTKENIVMSYNESELVYEFNIPGEEILMSSELMTFTVTATDITGLKTTSEEVSVKIDNKPQFISLVPARNSATDENKSPLIQVTLLNEGVNPQVKLTLVKGEEIILTNQVMTPGTVAGTYSYQTGTLTDGGYVATVTVVRADTGTATETWNFTVGTPAFRPFFGQLHAHTAEYSDGSGTLNNALDYLKNLNALDNVNFISVTDHSNYFDATSAANPAEALNDKTQMTAASLTKWNQYVSTMETYNETNIGETVALPGFEMTWSGGPGHINTFNSDGLISRNNSTLNNKTGDAGMKSYYETLIGDSDPLANLSQFNHPGSTFGTFSDFAYWSPSYDNKMVAVEVGNGEGAIGSGGYFPSYTEYTKALDKGWHVSPTNNQDNHKGKWGNANTARTVIITDTLSSDGLLQGLKDMSVYSTEDQNLNIWFTVNDKIMGSIIDEVPTAPLQFTVNIDDPDSGDIISKVEIVTNSGRVARSQTFSSTLVDWTFELPAVQGYYYVRVTQADKNIAVTSPVWIGQAPRVGISSLESSAKMPVTNETLNLKTTLFNNELNSVTITSIKYEVGGEIIKSDTMAEVVGTAGVYQNTIEYKPVTPGIQKITVTAAIMVDGQEIIFTQDIEINVRDSEKLVYIGIDASHYNEYVRGNYKDSMGNFAEMAMDYDVRVVELETSEALIAATQNDKYEMLVFTPPTRRNGSNFLIGYKNYTDEEILAVKSFAESGKTVILTGWSDYYENYTKYSDGTAYTLPLDEHMSAQQNKLIAALGSSLRISDDQIQDTVNNGGSAQRLYLENYNLDNPFLANVKADEQVYSNYGGASIYAVGTDMLPTSALPSSVSPMVYGFVTSTSLDSDKDGTTGVTGVTVPKYDDMHMVAASEVVSYDSGKEATIIVAGSAFMSNFEIQTTLDSYATPAYSNYTILENVVQSVNPIVITPISEVHAAAEGIKFTVEGIVTSNASGFDKDTAFFDSIYMQDATAGINLFPVAGDVRAGQTVQITGTTSSYNGERQLNVEKLTIVDPTIKALPEPKAVTSSDILNATYLGSLVKVTGKVTEIGLSNGVVESIYVKDSNGDICRIFIDGYITKDAVIANLKVGAGITAVGLSSIDAEGSRVRIRDRADIACTEAVVVPTPDDSDDDSEPADPKPEPKKDEITVGSNMTSGQLASAIQAAMENSTEELPKITLEFGDDVDNMTLNSEVLDSIENGNVQVTISKAGVKYVIPAEELGLTELTALLGEGALESDTELNISVNKVDAATRDEISEWAAAQGMKLVGNPVEFKMSVRSKSTGESVNVTKFNNYVERVFELGSDVNMDDLATGVYVDSKGRMQPVPTIFYTENGIVYASIKSMTNSTYALVSLDRDVKGIEGHWSEAVIQKMADRLILTNTLEFEADKAITRAEFTDYIVRALGLYREDQEVNGKFTDITSDSNLAGSIIIANKWGIVNGYMDQTFRPDQTISRQEAMTMYANALQYLEIETVHTNRLNQFSDKDLVAGWAHASVMTVLDKEVFNGMTETTLSPLGTLTHAESLQAIYNLLQKSGLNE
ncbi:MAG: S-layer homology domain-containing protein [Bacillota bacterium]|nr:S-layer homology domain-containing protein [Bacillota bacterium]